MSTRPVILFDPLPRPRRQIFGDADWARFAALGEIVGLDYATTHGIVSRGDMEALAMICRAANIERPLFVTLAVLAGGGQDAMNQAEHFGRLYTAVPVEAAQRAMRFFKVRKTATESMAA